jgi:hypothetical protein
MEDNVLRRRWLPESEDQLLQAYKEGTLEERNWCDLKREVENTKGANKELARDLASFAIDGGTLIIGLDEDEPAGDPLHPVALANLSERVERIALDRVDPPLPVSCTTVEASANKSDGYLLVHVPASAMAPHQVGGTYYGRGDKTKISLSDPIVQMLFARRAQWTRGIEDILRSTVRADPFGSGEQHGHLFLVAQPVGGRPGLLKSSVGNPQWQVNLQNLREEVVQDLKLGTVLQSWFRGDALAVNFGQMFTTRKSPLGAMLTSRGVNMTSDPKEAAAQDLEIREDGGLRYFYGGAVRNAAKEGTSSSSKRDPEIYLTSIIILVRQFLIATLNLSDTSGYSAMWDIGLAINGTREAFGRGRIQIINAFPLRWPNETFEQTTRTSVAELALMPGAVTERLMGLMLRTFSLESNYQELLTD